MVQFLLEEGAGAGGRVTLGGHYERAMELAGKKGHEAIMRVSRAWKNKIKAVLAEEERGVRGGALVQDREWTHDNRLSTSKMMTLIMDYTAVIAILLPMACLGVQVLRRRVSHQNDGDGGPAGFQALCLSNRVGRQKGGQRGSYLISDLRRESAVPLDSGSDLRAFEL